MPVVLPDLNPSLLVPAVAGDTNLVALSGRFDDDFKPAPLEHSQQRIEAAQRRMWASRNAGLLIIFQGLDAAGKDGSIRHLAQAMDPMGVRVKGFVQPTIIEQQHDFLWRAWPHFPGRGEVALFNRSYYEAVLIERQLAAGAPVADDGQSWQSRFRIIRELEQHLLSSGTRILKFWIQVSPDEQRKRLLRRVEDRNRQWKFSPSDVENWKQRDQYLGYASEMIAATHVTGAPWHLLPGDDKDLARRAVCERVAEVLEQIAGDYPREDKDVLKTYRDQLS